MTTINLFELMEKKGIEVPKELKNEKKKVTKDNKPTKTTTKAKKAEPVKYVLPFNLYYSGTWYEMTQADFSGKESIELEDLLEHMKIMYAFRILKKERITVEYDKDENDVILVLKNPSKGSSYFQGLHRYEFNDQSVRFIKADTYGYIIGPKENSLGHIKEMKGFNAIPGVYLEYKVSSEMLTEILQSFVMNFPKEVLAQIYFDRKTQKYALHYPEQITTNELVMRDEGQFFLNDKDNVLVAEIHSHGKYPANFSNRDNDNEVDFLIYGVIGELSSGKPSYNFRIGFNGLFHEIEITDLFDLQGGTYA